MQNQITEFKDHTLDCQKIEVSIVIINYNTFQLTCNCIESIKSNEASLSYEIILVDNSSSECSAFEFKRKFPEITLIQSSTNVGFAKGNNLGISHAKGRYILLLNSDTVLLNNAVSLSISFLEKKRKVGVVTARLEHDNGDIQLNCLRFVSIRYKLFELFRLQKIVGRYIGGKILLGPFFDYNSVAYPDWVWGTFFMFRRESLERLPQKRLSDDFFMYVEDMEWCKEFRRLGYQIAFQPAARLVHFVGKSGGDKIGMIESNNALFMDKYYTKLHKRSIQFLDRMLALKLK